MLINVNVNSESKEEKEKLWNLFKVFPNGMIIFEKVKLNADHILRYINDMALKILTNQTRAKSEEEIKNVLKKFKKLKNFNNSNEVYLDINDKSEDNLCNRIFETENLETSDRYVSKDVMIYVKIKTHGDYKLVSLESFNDERITIQNNIVKNIKTQYLLTLSHELNNPLNSLSHSVNELISNKEMIDKKNALKGMKINLRLIKFFIKNFVFSLKMSFDQKIILRSERAEESNCASLEFVLKRIIDKNSIFYQSKRIKIKCNLNLLRNVYVTYDYEYFKSFLKNIFMFLFYKVERSGKILIEFEFEKELKIVFKKNEDNNLAASNTKKLYLKKNSSPIDTSFVSEISIETSVKTLEMLKEIVNKFAAMLGIKIKIIEEHSPWYFVLYLKYEIEEDLWDMNQDLAEEITSRNSKKRNTLQLDRSNIYFNDTFSNINDKSDLINLITNSNTKNELQRDQSFSMSNDSVNYLNLKNKKRFSKEKAKDKKSFIKDEKKSLRLKKNEEESPLRNQLARNINKYRTNVKKFKESASIVSEKNNSDIETIQATNNPKTMFLRSNFTFKYNNLALDREFDLEVDLFVDKNGETLQKKITNNSLNEVSVNKQDTGSTYKITTNINSITKNFITNANEEGNISISRLSSNRTNSNRSSKENKNVEKQTVPSKFFDPEKKIIKRKTDSSKILKSEKNISAIPIRRKTTKKVLVENEISSTPKAKIQSVKTISYSISSSNNKHVDILVVDDDSFNLSVLNSMLKNMKLQNDTCMNGLECINKLKNKYSKGNEYKLILMDVMMPVMDGIEASTKIEEMIKNNKLNSNIKIIIISAHNDMEIINRATSLSCVKEFLSKPVKRNDIQRIINKYYL